MMLHWLAMLLYSKNGLCGFPLVAQGSYHSPKMRRLGQLATLHYPEVWMWVWMVVCLGAFLFKQKKKNYLPTVISDGWCS